MLTGPSLSKKHAEWISMCDGVENILKWLRETYIIRRSDKGLRAIVSRHGNGKWESLVNIWPTPGVIYDILIIMVSSTHM